MSVVHITKDNYDDIVIRGEKKVLLDFWASWCGPCRMVAPILEQIAGENEAVKVVKINVDEQGELASRFRIVSIPTLVVMRQGQEVNRSVGAMPKEAILALLG